MDDTRADTYWSLARITRQNDGNSGETVIWTHSDTHRDVHQTRKQLDTAVQGMLAGGFEPFQVVYTSTAHYLWFKAPTDPPHEPGND